MQKLLLSAIATFCLFAIISCSFSDSYTGEFTYYGNDVAQWITYFCDTDCKNCDTYVNYGKPDFMLVYIPPYDVEKECKGQHNIYRGTTIDFIRINNDENDKNTHISVPINGSNAFSLHINLLADNEKTGGDIALYDSIKIEIKNTGSARISFTPDYLKEEMVYKGAKINETIKIYSLTPDTDIDSIQTANIRFLGFSRGYGYFELDPDKKFTIETR